METKETLSAIYEKIDIAIAFPELQAQDKGNYYLVVCPECQKKEAFIYKASKAIICNRQSKCCYKSTLWDYAQKKYTLSGQETLFKLADLAGYAIEKGKVSSEKLAEIETEKKKENVLSVAMEHFKSLVDQNYEYLFSRGYTKEDIDGMGLGYFPGAGITQKYLIDKGFDSDSINQINAFAFNENSWNRTEYKLVFPFRNKYGQIITIFGRLTRQLSQGEKESDKYKPFSNFQKDDFFGIETASKEIVVVEGYLDVLLSQARGLKNIVACGGNTVTEKQIENAQRQGIKSITLCLDNDEAGRKGTKESIKKIVAKGIDCYIMSLPLFKDLDEFLAKGQKSVQDFEQHKKQAVFASRWLAENLLKEKNLSQDKEKKECFDGLLWLYGTFTSVTDKEAIKEAMQQSFDETEIKIFLEEKERKQAQEKKAQETRHAIEKRNLEIKMLLGKMEQEQQENNGVSDILSYAESLKAIENEYQKTTARAKQSQSQWLDGLFKKEKENEGKELLGYALGKDFYPIQKDLEGIQPGLYILGAQTNIGKTAFVANLAIQLLETNTGLKVLYFSLDDNKDIIATRFRAILAFSDRNFANRPAYESQNIMINEFRKPLDAWKSQKRAQANAKLKEFADSERLFVYDIADTPSIADIELVIRRIASGKIAVVIDGLYNASVGESQGKREENIERANKIKALVDSYSIPLICTAEVRKRSNQSKEAITIDDLMETGKFGYNANLVWLLYKQGQDDDNNEMLTLTLDYAKNKLSGFKGKQEIQYFRKYAKMFVEWPKKDQSQTKGITQEAFDVPGIKKEKSGGKK